MPLLSYADTVLNTYAKTSEAHAHLLTVSKPFNDCRLQLTFKGEICVPRQYTLMGKRVKTTASRLAFTIKTGRPPAPNLYVKCEKGTARCCNPDHMYETIARTDRCAAQLVREIPQSKQEATRLIKENVDHSESPPIASLVIYYEQRLAAKDVEIKQLHTKLNEIKKALS